MVLQFELCLAFLVTSRTTVSVVGRVDLLVLTHLVIGVEQLVTDVTLIAPFAIIVMLRIDVLQQILPIMRRVLTLVAFEFLILIRIMLLHV